MRGKEGGRGVADPDLVGSGFSTKFRFYFNFFFL